DRSVTAPDEIERLELGRRRTELIQAGKDNRARWLETPPAAEPLDAMRETLSALLRRRMLGLGPLGTLYTHRVDALERRADTLFGRPAPTWILLEDMAALVAEMDEA